MHVGIELAWREGMEGSGSRLTIQVFQIPILYFTKHPWFQGTAAISVSEIGGPKIWIGTTLVPYTNAER